MKDIDGPIGFAQVRDRKTGYNSPLAFGFAASAAPNVIVIGVSDVSRSETIRSRLSSVVRSAVR